MMKVGQNWGQTISKPYKQPLVGNSPISCIFFCQYSTTPVIVWKIQQRWAFAVHTLCLSLFVKIHNITCFSEQNGVKKRCRKRCILQGLEGNLKFQKWVRISSCTAARCKNSGIKLRIVRRSVIRYFIRRNFIINRIIVTLVPLLQLVILKI